MFYSHCFIECALMVAVWDEVVQTSVPGREIESSSVSLSLAKTRKTANT